MKILNLTAEKLSEIAKNNEIIGQGSNGIVYKLDENTLFKFRYKDYNDDFEFQGNTLNLRKLHNISKTIDARKQTEQILGFKSNYLAEEIEHANRKQTNIGLTTLTQGLVMVDNCLVGYLLKYHKNMVNLYDYLYENKLSTEQLKLVRKNIHISVEELLENAVYLYDLTTRNILLNPVTCDIQLVDLEERMISTDSVEILRDAVVRSELEKIDKFLLDNTLQYIEDNNLLGQETFD